MVEETLSVMKGALKEGSQRKRYTHCDSKMGSGKGGDRKQFRRRNSLCKGPGAEMRMMGRGWKSVHAYNFP